MRILIQKPAAYNAEHSSHEHECIAWKTSRVDLIENSQRSVFGRNDAFGQNSCNYDFTAFHAAVLLEYPKICKLIPTENQLNSMQLPSILTRNISRAEITKSLIIGHLQKT